MYKNSYGQYHSKGKLKNGKKDGKWINWNLNGSINTETIYVEGTTISKTHYHRALEKVRYETSYKDGEPSYRKFFTYHDNGNIRMKGAEVMPGNMFDGVVTTWYKNGQKENEVNYSKGKLLGRATWWFENGQISSETFHSLDGFVGIHRYWHENGQISGEFDYSTNLAKHAKSWYDNGQLELDWIYLNGKMDGEYIKLDRDGKIYYKATYKEGKCINGDCPK